MNRHRCTIPSVADTQRNIPQQIINDFWDNFISKSPCKVTSILPWNPYDNPLTSKQAKNTAVGRNVTESYKAAAQECKANVLRIANECRRTNEKFSDPDFDIERDFGCGDCLHGLLPRFCQDTKKSRVNVEELKDSLDTLVESGIFKKSSTPALDFSALRECLEGLDDEDEEVDEPESVHRVNYIFETSNFCVNGYSADSVHQGELGDCWLLSTIATLCSVGGLMERVCVARDEECGVYGFVFHRDGEWFSTVVDDNLYLTWEDYHNSPYDSSGKKERDYRKLRQTGSEALHFAHCGEKNETWLPLLEKAYAKIHGDYDSLDRGYPGEAVEDMTGGVTVRLATNKVLNPGKLWEQLVNNKDFVFSAVLPWVETGEDGMKGLTTDHSYSILRATEESDQDGKRLKLVLIRNCWGSRDRMGIGEWTGPWSDGSKEWTPYWMQKLNHQFGDDGRFWMLYDDLLRNFSDLDRTRLFNEDWTVVHQWTTINVPWVTGYCNTKFSVEIKKQGPAVFVLSQLDTRYFLGLEGQYSFHLKFILQEEDSLSSKHIVHAHGGASGGGRSVSCDLELGPGRYEVLPMIVASRKQKKAAVEDVVKEWAEKKPQKLRQIGLNYDLAHAKLFIESEENNEDEDKQQPKAGSERGPALAVITTPTGALADPSSNSAPASPTSTTSSIPHAAEEQPASSAPDEGKSPPSADNTSDSKTLPWNAVCVVGLRLYSKDPDVSMKIISASDVTGV